MKPVTILAAGGKPCTNVASLAAGAQPMTPIAAGGLPITLVASGGYPVTLVNEDGSLWSEAPPAPEHALVAPYVAAMTVAPTTEQRQKISDLCWALDAAGLLLRKDRLFLIHSHHEQAARINLLLPSEILTAVNSPVFTPYGGFAGDGATSYLQAPSTHAGGSRLFTQDSAFVGFGVSAQSGGGVRSQTGATSGNVNQIAISDSGSSNYRANDATGDTATSSLTGSSRIGSFAADRPNSATKRLFWNGAKVVEHATASTAISAQNASLGRSAGAYSPDQFWWWGAGASLTEAQHAALVAALNTYRSEYVA